MKDKINQPKNRIVIRYARYILSVSFVSWILGFGLATGARNIQFNEGETTYATAFGFLTAFVICIVLAMILFYFLRVRLNLITQTLKRINAGETALTIPPNWLLLAELTQEVNLLGTNQQQTRHLRGQLVHQISEAAAQEERNRLARDLHDSIKQQIFSISVSAAAANARIETDIDGARIALQDVKQSAQEAMVEMRAMLQQLSPAPLEKVGLLQAMRDQCNALAYRTGADVQATFSELPPDDRLPPGAQEAIFRITQEALSNIARHARAKHVNVTLAVQDETQLTLNIHDDGQGFDTNERGNGMGLSNMQNRLESVNGQIDIHSTPGNGTQIQVKIPLVEKIGVANSTAEIDQFADSYFGKVMARYGVFAWSLASIIFSVSLLLMRALHRTENIFDDAVLVVIFIMLIILGIGGFFTAIWSFLKSSQAMNELLVNIGREHRIYYKTMRHILVTNSGIALISLWLAPLIWVGERFADWLPLATAGGFFLVLIYNYYRAAIAYDKELKLLTREQRLQEINHTAGLLRGSWTSIGILIFILAITDTFRNGLAFFPQEPDEWVTTAFILIAVLLVINQLLNLRYYRRQKLLYEQGE